MDGFISGKWFIRTASIIPKLALCFFLSLPRKKNASQSFWKASLRILLSYAMLSIHLFYLPIYPSIHPAIPLPPFFCTYVVCSLIDKGVLFPAHKKYIYSRLRFFGSSGFRNNRAWLYRGFRKYRIRKYRNFGSNGHFVNSQIEILH